MLISLSPSPPESVSSGSSRSRHSFLSPSSSSTFSDVSVSSLPSPPHSGSKTHAFFASPFPTRPPSPSPPRTPPPLPSKNSQFFSTPVINVSTPTTQSIIAFDAASEPTPRPKDLEPTFSALFQPPSIPDELTSGSIISADADLGPILSPSSPHTAARNNQPTTLRLLSPLGYGAFSSVWLVEDLSPVPLVLRSRRSVRDLRRQASLKSSPIPSPLRSPSLLPSPSAAPSAYSFSRASSLRKLRKRIPGTRPICVPSTPLHHHESSPSESSLGSTSLARHSSLPSSHPISALGGPRSRTKSLNLSVSIDDPDRPRSPSKSSKARLVAVKMTVRSGAGVDGDAESEREKERTRVAFVREVEVLRHISHPNITPLLTHLTTPTHHVLVLPYLPGGDLLALLNTDASWTRLRESVLKRIWAELCEAVGWMHGVGLVHRDIKLENILLTTQIFTTTDPSAPAPTLADLPPSPAPIIKLTDFGLSRFIDIRSDEERRKDRRARMRARRQASSGSSSSDAGSVIVEGMPLSMSPPRIKIRVVPASADGSVAESPSGETIDDDSDIDEDDEDEEDDDQGPLLTTRCGSEAYAAPELVMGGSSSASSVSSRRSSHSSVRSTYSAASTSSAAALVPRPPGAYDPRETDAWACGVVLYALCARRLPFGEGADGLDAGGYGGRMARRAWLMRIARGEWEWPFSPLSSSRAMAADEEEELIGERLVESEGAKRIVAKLLVRDPRKRAKVSELWGDVWMGGSEDDVIPDEELYHYPHEGRAEEEQGFTLYDELVLLEHGEDDELLDEDEEDEELLERGGLLVDMEGIGEIARREVV